MSLLAAIFYIAALILLLLAAFRVATKRVELGWLGLACWLVAAVFVPLLPRLLA